MEAAIKIAVIGAGNHSNVQHGPALKAYAEKYPGRISLTAVCDLDIGKAELYARTFGFSRTYNDIDEMLEKEKPDGLVVVTPIKLTKTIVESLMGRGVPLMIEKPPGENPAQTMVLLQSAIRTGTPHVVSFDRRFSPAVLKAREWIDGKLPERKPRAVAARMLRARRKEPDFPIGTGIHLLDNVLSFTGRPMRVHTEIIPTGESHSYFSTIICDNGIHASTVIAPCCGMPDGEVYEIYGDEYHVFIDFFAERVIIHDMGSCVMDWRLPHDADKAYRGGCFGEAENFIAYLSEMKKGNTTKRLTPDLTDGLYSMLTAEAVSAGGDREIKCDIPQDKT
jgi:predicted dehydrogenase